MSDGPADSEKAEDLYKRSFDLILKVFGEEDFKASSSSQAALATGAIPNVYFGGMKCLVPLFHHEVESLLPASVI